MSLPHSFHIHILLFSFIMMDENDKERTSVAVACLLFGHGFKMKRRKRKQRRMWFKPWIQQRDRLDAYNALVKEFALSEREDYRRFMRMNSGTFHELLEVVRPYITRRETVSSFFSQ